MSLREAADAIPELAGKVRPGLQALRDLDRGHVRAASPKRLRASLDLDGCLKESLPGAPRWDYAIACAPVRSEGAAKGTEPGADGGAADCVYWVEIHPGSDVRGVVAKYDWLRKWLRERAPTLEAMEPREFHWVSSGKTVLAAGDPKRKALADRGLSVTGGLLRIP